MCSFWAVSTFWASTTVDAQCCTGQVVRPLDGHDRDTGHAGHCTGQEVRLLDGCAKETMSMLTISQVSTTHYKLPWITG